MASLTKTAVISRKAIRYGIYAVILIIILRLAFRGTVSLYKMIFPPKAPEPTVSFGKLPALPFPEGSKQTDLNYVLETTTGTLPEIPEQVPVYFMPTSISTLYTLENARNTAASLGFDRNGKPVVENVDNVYVFNHPKQPSILTMNIITKVFAVTYDVNSNPAIITNLLVSPENAISSMRALLKNAGLLQEDIADSPATTRLLSVERGEYVPSKSLSDANLIKVNIFRKNLGPEGKIRSVTPKMPQANIWFLLAGPDGKTVISAEYFYYRIDYQRSGTYPLKTAGKAWEELTSGKGYIINPGDRQNPKKTIRNIYLAYYDPGQYAPYLQPVIVFEGDDDFYGYVPAITAEYYTGD